MTGPECMACAESRWLIHKANPKVAKQSPALQCRGAALEAQPRTWESSGAFSSQGLHLPPGNWVAAALWCLSKLLTWSQCKTRGVLPKQVTDWIGRVQ